MSLIYRKLSISDCLDHFVRSFSLSVYLQFLLSIERSFFIFQDRNFNKNKAKSAIFRSKIKENVKIISFSDDVKTFLGNQTHSDHFKLLRQEGGSLLIGARNVVYNISLDDLSENMEQRIEWNSRERDTELCLVKGKSEEDCHNYIRVLAKQNNESLLVCGTNSYNPRCRSYLRNKDGTYEVAREQSGRGYCPYDPRHNSTFMFTGELIFLIPLLYFNAYISSCELSNIITLFMQHLARPGKAGGKL